jgi:methylaspartate ammonia-lyase
MLAVGEIVFDLKTGGTGMVIDRWSDTNVDLDLVTPDGRCAVVNRNTADLESMGRSKRRRGRW